MVVIQNEKGDAMISLWSDINTLPEFKPLYGSISADVLVIGGGMAGLLCARLLQDEGADCVLLEAGRLCGGVTAGTTAKITALHGLRCRELLRRFGRERTRLYYRANQEAVEQLVRMCSGVDCGLERQDAFVACTETPGAVEDEAAALRQVDVPAEVSDNLPLGIGGKAVRLGGQAQFDPLRFAASIAGGLRIYEGSPVVSLRGERALTQIGSVTARRIIIATHFPFINRHGSYFIKLHQERSYVIALENAPKAEGMYLDDCPGGLSFRSHGGLLLMGGAGGRTGEAAGGWEELERQAAQLFPQARVRYRWAAQDCMTTDGVPCIGRYSALTPGWLVDTGFNKWGMTSSMVAARLLTEMVQGKESTYAPVFSPSRNMINLGMGDNAVHAVKNILTPTRPRCPHMGCALKWNPQEHAWECPCHGSRFDEQGGLLEGPAQRRCTPPER